MKATINKNLVYWANGETALNVGDVVEVTPCDETETPPQFYSFVNQESLVDCAVHRDFLDLERNTRPMNTEQKDALVKLYQLLAELHELEDNPYLDYSLEIHPQLGVRLWDGEGGNDTDLGKDLVIAAETLDSIVVERNAEIELANDEPSLDDYLDWDDTPEDFDLFL